MFPHEFIEKLAQEWKREMKETGRGGGGSGFLPLPLILFFCPITRSETLFVGYNRKCHIGKEVNSQRIGLKHQHGSPQTRTYFLLLPWKYDCVRKSPTWPLFCLLCLGIGTPIWPDCDRVKMLYWKKQTNNRQNKTKIKLGLQLDFHTYTHSWHSCEEKKRTYYNYWKFKRTYHFENDVHTQAQAQASGGSRRGAQWAWPPF